METKWFVFLSGPEADALLKALKKTTSIFEIYVEWNAFCNVNLIPDPLPKLIVCDSITLQQIEDGGYTPSTTY